MCGRVRAFVRSRGEKSRLRLASQAAMVEAAGGSSSNIFRLLVEEAADDAKKRGELEPGGFWGGVASEPAKQLSGRAKTPHHTRRLSKTLGKKMKYIRNFTSL